MNGLYADPGIRAMLGGFSNRGDNDCWTCVCVICAAIDPSGACSIARVNSKVLKLRQKAFIRDQTKFEPMRPRPSNMLFNVVLRPCTIQRADSPH